MPKIQSLTGVLDYKTYFTLFKIKFIRLLLNFLKMAIIIQVALAF